jgi:hypothetical protein
VIDHLYLPWLQEGPSLSDQWSGEYFRRLGRAVTGVTEAAATVRLIAYGRSLGGAKLATE